MKKLLAVILAAALLLVLALCGASAEDGYADYTCEEQQFSTKIPLTRVFIIHIFEKKSNCTSFALNNAFNYDIVLVVK